MSFPKNQRKKVQMNFPFPGIEFRKKNDLVCVTASSRVQ